MIFNGVLFMVLLVLRGVDANNGEWKLYAAKFHLMFVPDLSDYSEEQHRTTPKMFEKNWKPCRYYTFSRPEYSKPIFSRPEYLRPEFTRPTFNDLFPFLTKSTKTSSTRSTYSYPFNLASGVSLTTRTTEEYYYYYEDTTPFPVNE